MRSKSAPIIIQHQIIDERISINEHIIDERADIKKHTISMNLKEEESIMNDIQISATDHFNYQNRNVSNTQTLSSIICVVAGTGILAIPHALSEAGWMGLLGLAISACMSQFTGYILIQCLYHQNGRRLKDYADIGLLAFGKPGQFIGWLFSQCFLFLTPTLYLIMASDNINEILVQNGFIWLTRRACIWIISIVIGIPFILVRNIKDVSFLSTFASIATISLMLIVCVISMSSTNYLEEIQQVHHDIVIPKYMPIAFSTFSFSYHGHVIYPHLEASMIDPNRWSKVLLVSTCVVSMMYTTIGIICYLVYGNQIQSPIYLSLPVGTSQQVAMFVITIHVLLVIPFYLYIFTSNIELWWGIDKKSKRDEKEKYFRVFRILLRTAEIIACGVVAMFIPYFSDFMTLISTLFANVLSFVLPTLFWIKLNYTKDLNIFVSCIIIALFGLFCTLFGTIDAIKILIHDYLNSK